MATWKKVIVSGSQSHLQGITASNIPIGSGQTNILTYDATSGQIKYIATSSIVVSAAGGTIGAAEDGTYTDGVYTDFTTTTPIGTAVDRFNELFTALVPATPPAFAELAHDSNWSPLDARTFVLNTSSGYTAVTGTGSLTAINNGVPTTISPSGFGTGTQVRYGLVNNLTQLNFELQRTIAANSGSFTNYSDNAAEIPVGGGDAYFIDINGTTTTPVSSSVSNPTASFAFLGGTIPAAATSSFITTGQSFPQKLWRDFTNLNLQIPTGSYRRGWNYMKVFQSSSLGVRMTNYIDWIYEPAMQHGTNFTTAESITNLSGSGRRDISGIHYYTGFTCIVSASVTDFYSCSYNPNTIEMSSTPISFLTDSNAITSGPNGVAANLNKSRFTPVAPTSVTQKLEMGTAVTASNATVRLVTTGNNTLSVTYTATGPHMNTTLAFKTSGPKTATSQTILLDGSSTISLGETIETFVTESYRVPSASYNTQADLNTAVFSAATSLLASPYTSELAVWNGALNYPTVVPDYSAYNVKIQASPPNYSSATGTRYFYRRFRHASTGGTTQTKQFTFSFSGGSFAAGTSGEPTTANQMTAHIKIPAATGYRNMMILAPDAVNFPTAQLVDNTGCFKATATAGTPSIISGTPFEVNMVSVPSSFSATNQSYVIRIGMFQGSTSAKITNITAN